MFVSVYLCYSSCFADLSNQEISGYLTDVYETQDSKYSVVHLWISKIHTWDIHGLVRALGFYRGAFAWGVASTVIRFLAQKLCQMPTLFLFSCQPYRRWLSTRFLYMSLRGTDYTKVRKPTTSLAVPRPPLLSSLGAEANTFLHCWRHTYPQSEQFFLLLGQRRITFFFPGLAHQSCYSFLFLFFVLPSLIVTML